MNDTVSLAGRVGLVTGASRRQGLGFAIACAAAGEGALVLLSARDGALARALAAEIDGAGKGRAEGHALDITDPASIEALRETIEREHGRLDVLVGNAAGINRFGERAEVVDLDDARSTTEVTLFGTWATVEAFLPLLRASEHGRIVNVGSGAGSHGDEVFGLRTGNAMGAAYAVAKAALHALSDRLAHEEREREGSRLRINAVCPGFTATFDGGETMGARPPADSVPGVLWAATLPDDGPTGGFFRDGEPLPW